MGKARESEVAVYVQEEEEEEEQDKGPADEKEDGKSIGSDEDEEEAWLSPEHVRHIRRGEFMYDPATVEKLTRLGRKLADIESYVDEDGWVNPREYRTLAADLSDYFSLISLFQEQTLSLHENHQLLKHSIKSGRGKNISIVKRLRRGGSTAWDFLLKFIPCSGLCRKKKSPVAIQIPQSVQKYQRFQRMVLSLNFILGILDEASDIVFIIALRQIESFQTLFYASLTIFILVAFFRWTVLIAYTDAWKGFKNEVDGFFHALFSCTLRFNGEALLENTSHFLAWFLSPVIPELSMTMLQKDFNAREPVKQTMIGESGGSAFSDPISAQAKILFFEVSSTSWIAFSFLIKDLLQLGVQSQFLLIGYDEEGNEIDTAFWLAFTTTIFRIVEQLFILLSASSDRPGLQNQIMLRQLAFDSLEPSGKQTTPERISKFVNVFESSNLRTRKIYNAFLDYISPVLLEEGPSLNDKRDRSRENSCLRLVKMPRFPFKLMHGNDFFQVVRTLELGNLHFNQETLPSLVTFISSCRYIQRLELSFTTIQGADTSGILTRIARNCSRIEVISLDHCTWVHENDLLRFLKICGSRLVRLSIRSVPATTDRTLIVIGKYCTVLRELFLDQSMDKSADRTFHGSAIKCLANGCAGTLTNIKMSNLQYSGTMEELLPLFKNPQIKQISVAGIKAVNDSFLEHLFDSSDGRQPPQNLQSIRLTSTRITDRGSQILAGHGHALKSVSLGGTQVSLKGVEALYDLCSRLGHVEYYNTRELTFFYAKLLVLQLKKLASAVPYILPARSNASEEFLAQFQDILEDHGRGLRTLLTERMSSGDPSIEVQILQLVVTLLDCVRKQRYRVRPYVRSPTGRLLSLGFHDKEFSFWEKKLRKHDFKMAFDTLNSLVSPSRRSSADMQRDSLKRENSTLDWDTGLAFNMLPSFGVLSTKRINILVDAKDGLYRFLGDSSSITGKISIIHRITLGNKRGVTLDDNERRSPRVAKLLSRYIAIPHDAEYFCFAYPIEDGETRKLIQQGALLPGKYEMAEQMLKAFGGFLYFDKTKAFLSASVLTVGSALAFNGPFKLSRYYAQKLMAEKRWNDVTLDHLKLRDGRVRQFAWIFPHEFSGGSIGRHNYHGGFAYSIRGKDGSIDFSQDVVFFALSDIQDTFLVPEEEFDQDSE